jgi:transposase
MYSTEHGRPSIDPVVLIKMAFIQYTFGIRSMRKTIEEIDTNLSYLWFLGIGFHDSRR